MSRFHHTSGVTITLRDDPEWTRVVMRGGRPRLDFQESRSDRESLRRCFLDLAQALLAVGARRIFLPMLRPPRIERESDLAELQRLELSYDRLLLYSDHTSGGNSFGADPGLGVTNRDGRVFGSENVYVADSSLFPSACGVSPSWTIMALSRMVASGLAAMITCADLVSSDIEITDNSDELLTKVITSLVSGGVIRRSDCGSST